MTAPALPATETVPSGGTVFDIGYRNYTGAREGRGRGRLAIVKNGIRTALGLGRGGRAKILPWLFIALLSGIAFIMALVAGAMGRLGGPEAAEQVPSHVDFYGASSILLFVFAALVAPELLCRDRRERTITLYLVRPLTGADYVAARYAAFLAVITAASWVPHTILFLGLLLDAQSPAAYLRDNWLDVPRYLAAGLITGTYVTGLALLTASFTTRRAYASVFLVGLFIISTPFTIGVASEVEGPVGQWISMFNLTNIPAYVNNLIFGEISDVTEEAPALLLPAYVHVLWYLLWTLTPIAILWARYRRLSP